MIGEFLSSWSLFYNSYLATWLIGILLALLGVPVVAKDQIFFGAAVSQASTFGVALGIGLAELSSAEFFQWFGSEQALAILAVSFSILSALFASRHSRKGQESQESVTGWIFLIASSLTILVVSHCTHDQEHIHRLFSISPIGATLTDVVVFSVFTLATVALLIPLNKRILLLVLDEEMATAVGINAGFWSMVIFGWIGLALGLSIHTSGMLYTFGCLVLPAMIAKNLCREVRPMFFAAPAAALVIGIISSILSYHYDHPPAHTAVALQSAVLAAAWLWRWIRYLVKSV
ncbi:MAG: metal ABC transporter permease [Planctomycetes bacterium]|nr:metal ABC transporter permease [Planctomycetota bacterium]